MITEEINLADAIWWTPAELGRRWKKSADTIRRMAKTGKINAMTVGASLRIHRDEIRRYEASGLPAQPTPDPIVSEIPMRPAILRAIRDRQKGGSLA